jgi:hypothetical protein
MPAHHFTRSIPVHRSLHIIDIENLTGAEHTNLDAVLSASGIYRHSVEMGPMDQIIVGTNMSPDYRLTVGLEWPGARVVSGHGPNGADQALLAAVEPAWVIRRGFARVVIGSGDGCFAALGTILKRAGVVVHVIGRARAMHSSLWPASHHILALPAASAVIHPVQQPAEHLVAAA